jgi:hypothetical protein
MNALELQSPAQNTHDAKTAGRIRRKSAAESFLRPAYKSSDRLTNASLQTALLDMLANTEAGYAAVVEGVEEFLYQEELQAGRS